MSAHKPSNELVGIKEAAALLSVSTWTVRRLITAGEVKVIRLPYGGRLVRRLLFDVQDLRKLVTRSKSAER